MVKTIKSIIIILTIFSSSSLIAQHYESLINISLDGDGMFDVDLDGESIIFLGYSFYDNESCSPPNNAQATLQDYNVCKTNLPFLIFSDYINTSESIITNFNPFQNNIHGRLDAHTSIPLKLDLQNAGVNLFSVNYNKAIPNFQECMIYNAFDSNTGILSSITVQVTELGKNLWDLNPVYQNNNSIGCEDMFGLVVNSCNMSSHYALEYQLRDGGDIIQNWTDIVSFGYHAAPNIDIEDLFGAQPGYHVDIRLRYTENPSQDANDYSDTLIFLFESCSPELVDLVPTAEKCPGANNGSFTMTLDRDLDEDENEFLFVALYVQDENNPNVYTLIENEDTEILIDNEDETYSYNWPENLAPGNYKIKYQTRAQGDGDPDEQSWNSLEHSDPFTIESPDEVTYTLNVVDVNCRGGSDGQIQISANHGTNGNYQFRLNGGNWTDFSDPQSHDHTITGLPEDIYTVEVRDGNECMGTTQEDEVTIVQPEEEIQFSDTMIEEPTAFGFTNGSIAVEVSGGSPGYSYEWTDGNNNSVDTGAAQNNNGDYQIALEDIPAGTYTLTVWDSGYNLADQNNNAGCTYFDSFVVEEPLPLELNVQEMVPISCNSANSFNNPSNDGQLTAIASGGVPYDPPINGFYDYIYTWKKKDGNGIWQVLPNQNTDVLNNVDAGEYAVNIEDANGIKIGIYVNNLLQQEQDVIYVMEEPELLEIELDKTDVSCFNGNDGTATASISGGMPPYEVFWSIGASTQTVDNLIAGTYMVYVMDSFGCEATAQVTIEQAGGLEINILEQKDPICHEGNDGSITMEVTGGMPPYTYLWDNGESTSSLSILAEGIYTFQVTDSNDCTAFVEVELKSPSATLVELGEDRTLCNDQVHNVDISIDDPNATYLWTSNNGFYSTSPSIAISEAGIYTATVTTGLGCSSSDTIAIEMTNAEIDSQFLITSQAFAQEEVVLVNTSYPLGIAEDWIFPEGARVIEESGSLAILRFDEPGAYKVTLRNYKDGCYEDFTKSIVVDQARQLPDVGDAITPFIKEYKIYPNPSSGTFTVMLSLQETATVSLRLYGFTSNLAYDDRQLQGSADYEIPYTVDLPSGTYFLLLETAKENQIRKIVVL